MDFFCNNNGNNLHFQTKKFQSTQKVETRRYDFIQYENGKTFGKYGACLQTAKVNHTFYHIPIELTENIFLFITFIFEDDFME